MSSLHQTIELNDSIYECISANLRNTFSEMPFRFINYCRYQLVNFNQDQLIETMKKIDCELYSANIPRKHEYTFRHTPTESLIQIYADYTLQSYEINGTIYANQGQVHTALIPNIKKALLSVFMESDPTTVMTVKWVFYQDYNHRQQPFQQKLTEPFYAEAYEDNDIVQKIEDFVDAEQSVLILSGLPGTGKSRLVRQIMRTMLQRDASTTALYTTDKDTLENEEFYLDFLSSKEKLLILEDLDGLLIKRTEGNHMMSKLLNISDGVLSVLQGKKIVITTNIIKTNMVEPALLRNGRCFGVWQFNELSVKRANQLVSALGSELLLNKRMVAANIFAEVSQFGTNNVKQNVIGF